MSGSNVTPQPGDTQGATKPAIEWEEAFYLALAATVMRQTFPTYRNDLDIDESLSDAEAAGIVLARTIAKDYAMPASARRAGAVLSVFFIDALRDWFDGELDEILRAAGGTPEDVQECWPTQEDLYEAMTVDFAKLVGRGLGKGWEGSGNALKVPHRFYWEETLQAGL